MLPGWSSDPYVIVKLCEKKEELEKFQTKTVSNCANPELARESLEPGQRPRPRERLATSTTNLGRITRPRVVPPPRERVVDRALALVDLRSQPVDHHLEHGVDVVGRARRHPKRVEHCQRDLCVEIKL